MILKIGSIVVGTSFLIGAAASHGALPPKYQRIREMQAILESPSVASAFPDAEIIDQIKATRPDLYRVQSRRCTLDVRIVNDPNAPEMPGPRRFLVKPGKVTCKPA